MTVAFVAPWLAGASIEELYVSHYARLLRFCERRVAGAHRAEDLAQEAFTQAIRYFDSYDPDRPLWPWLCKIAVRIAQREAAADAHESPVDIAVLPAAEAWRDADAPEDALLLRAAMAQLPDRHRAALVLRYVHDLSAADAGRVLGIDGNAFAQLLLRARRRLVAGYEALTAEDATAA